MLIGRLRTAGAVRHVRWDGARAVEIEDPYAAFAQGREPADTGGPVTGELLAPSDPRVVVGIAQNGPGHAAPVQAWLKSPRTVVGSGETVTLRRDAGTTVAEGEIAIVIGRDTTGLTVDDAAGFVLGVTPVNDLSSPDRGSLDPRNYESKAGEGYTPLGPWIDTAQGLAGIPLVLRIGTAEIARTLGDELPVPIAECLAYVARWTRLDAGDIVMMGAPLANAPVQPGQTVEVEVAGIRLVTPTR